MEDKTRTVHIDTSIQIERCKGPKKAERVEESLRVFRFKSTSSYAKFEFKRAWLRDLAYLYHASETVTRLDEIIGYVNNRLDANPQARRRVSRCLEAIQSFLSRVPGDTSYDAALSRMQSHLRQAILGAYTWWDSSVTHEFKGTGCARAEEQPKLSGGKLDVAIPRCSRGEIKCAVHEFFAIHRESFTAIRSAIENRGTQASKELQKAIRIIDSAEKDSECLCDGSNCSGLGDILIAIGGLDMDCFAANNNADWTMLSEVLHKQLLNPVRGG